MEAECVGDGALEVYEVLSEEELQSFAARLEVQPETLMHIIDPMDGVAGINLRQELEQWIREDLEEKERTRGMTLEKLVADTGARLIPTLAAGLRRTQNLLAVEWRRQHQRFNLRQELQRWIREDVEEERTRGMTLEQLVTATGARLIPTLAAGLRRTQNLLDDFDSEEKEKEAGKHAPKPRAASDHHLQLMNYLSRLD